MSTSDYRLLRQDCQLLVDNEVPRRPRSLLLLPMQQRAMGTLTDLLNNCRGPD